MSELETLAQRNVRYAPELLAVLRSVGAEDRVASTGTPHSISIGAPGALICLFKGHLNITRNKILPRWKNAYEVALEATIEKVYGEKRKRDSDDGQFAITWLAKE